MRADAAPLLAIFEKKVRLEVPLFQRQYVWTLEHQWEPLWEDVSRKFSEYLEGRTDAPVHFLGAMVLDQKQTPTTHVERRQVIDGQQRLTTLQILLVVFRDFCRAHDAGTLAEECNGFVQNKGMMADPAIDRFKVWPTQLDRPQFIDVATAESPAALAIKHPLRKRKYARRYDPRPRMVEAYFFFWNRLEEYFVGTPDDPPLAHDTPIADRLEECFKALKGALFVAVIDLEPGDDAQVIFETLNARGEPLLPADLLKNYIFLRAARAAEKAEDLYEKYWRPFDDSFWRVEMRQGRLTRPRSDLFMQHFLASRRGVDIPIKHLFVEYRYWIDKERPFENIRQELQAIATGGANFRRMLEPPKGDDIEGLVTALSTFDTTTAFPLILNFLSAGLPPEEWVAISTVLESYIVRRAVCGYTPKNYNRVFLTLSRLFSKVPASSKLLPAGLSGLSGESAAWPSDVAFREAWLARHAYQVLTQPRVVHILRRLNSTYHSSKHEDITINSPLTVEHILPQDWVEHWPLSDGSTGLKYTELWDPADQSPTAVASRARNTALQTFGNLTLLAQPLNSSLSNGAWATKRTGMRQGTLLPMNQPVLDSIVWDEEAISRRGEQLFSRAVTVWPGPMTSAT